MDKYTITEMQDIHDRCEKAKSVLQDIRNLDIILDNENYNIVNDGTVSINFFVNIKDNDTIRTDYFTVNIPSSFNTLDILRIIRAMKDGELEALIEKKE